VKLCRLCNRDSLNRELPLELVEAFELMIPLRIVRAAEPDDDDDEDPATVNGAAVLPGLL
jgi:hypothetical protein